VERICREQGNMAANLPEGTGLKGPKTTRILKIAIQLHIE